MKYDLVKCKESQERVFNEITEAIRLNTITYDHLIKRLYQHFSIELPDEKVEIGEECRYYKHMIIHIDPNPDMLTGDVVMIRYNDDRKISYYDYDNSIYKDTKDISMPGDEFPATQILIATFDLSALPVFNDFEVYGLGEFALGFRNNLSLDLPDDMYMESAADKKDKNKPEESKRPFSVNVSDMPINSLQESYTGIRKTFMEMGFDNADDKDKEKISKLKMKVEKDAESMSITDMASMNRMVKKYSAKSAKEAMSKTDNTSKTNSDNSDEMVMTFDDIYSVYKKTDFSKASQEDIPTITLLDSTPKDKWQPENYQLAKDLVTKYQPIDADKKPSDSSKEAGCNKSGKKMTDSDNEDSKEQYSKSKLDVAKESGQVLVKESLSNEVTGSRLGELVGSKAEVTLIREGLNTRGSHFYSRMALEKAVESGLFKGIQVYLDHPKKDELPERQLDYLVAAITDDVWLAEEADGKTSVKAVIDVARESARELLRNPTVSKTIGMSINGSVECVPKRENGLDYKYVTAFASMRSVDIVTIPGAGGKINNVLESNNVIIDNKSDNFNNTIKNSKNTTRKNMAKIYEVLVNSLFKAISLESAYSTLPAIAVNRAKEMVGLFNVEDAVTESEGSANLDEAKVESVIRESLNAEVKYMQAVTEKVKEAMPKPVEVKLPDVDAIKESINGSDKVKLLTDTSKQRIVESVYFSMVNDKSELATAIESAIQSELSFVQSLTKDGKPVSVNTESNPSVVNESGLNAGSVSVLNKFAAQLGITVE